MDPILELKDICFAYGGIQALRGISLKIFPGEIIALIGANGAGKTTTLQCISGLLGKPKSGGVYFNGQLLSGKKPHEISRMGVIQILEGRKIFPHLTVRENLEMGAYTGRGDFSRDLEEMYERFPRLKERHNQMGGTLSGGEQQMLAVARALMAKPKILMMDEPSLGLAPLIVEGVFEIIKKINGQGIPILLVEQNSKIALEVASRGYVLETGKIVLEDDAKNLLHNEEVIKSYLGGRG
ncbi:MAG: ABC transporter ATP-binding protein [Treponema sp.]|jgi:branched-chain amino acid transport system ATP-binding protein|nr:ABC transporter ATP-binding protein [Treponema sp.]